MPYLDSLYQLNVMLDEAELQSPASKIFPGLQDTNLGRMLTALGESFGLDPSRITVVPDDINGYTSEGFLIDRPSGLPSATPIRRFVFGAPSADRADPSGRLHPDMMFVAAHEFAHSMLQTPPISAVTEQIQKPVPHSFRDWVDLADRFGWANYVMSELQSDLFGASVAGIRRWVDYRMGAAKEQDAEIASSNPNYNASTFADTVRVIDPKVIDDPNSNLHQLYRGVMAANMDLIAPSSMAREVEPSLKGPFADAAIDISSAAQFMFPFGTIIRESRPILETQHRLDNVKDDLQQLKALRDASGFLNGMGRVALDPMTFAGTDPYSKDELRIDSETHYVMKHLGNRLWTVGYALGKQYPELIGQTLTWSGGKFITPSGDAVDLRLPELPEVSDPHIEPPPDMQPVQEKMRTYYNRVRSMDPAKLDAVFRVMEMGQDYISQWKQWFRQTIRDISSE